MGHGLRDGLLVFRGHELAGWGAMRQWSGALQHESSLPLQLATHDERRTSASSSPASTNSSRREVLLGWLHELQQRSKQLLQPESAELPVMQWAMVCLGSIIAVSRADVRHFNSGSRCFCAWGH